MADRITIKMSEIRKLLKLPEVDAEVIRIAGLVENRVTAQALQTRIDQKKGRKRMRAAVIAGYEDGATAENTRRALLRSMDGVQ